MKKRIRILSFLLVALLLPTTGCFLFAPPHSDYRPIHQYAIACDAPAVQAILKTNSAAVNLPDDSHRTPLHDAASRNCTNVIAVLLHAGAKLEAKDQSGATPLHVAAQEGFIDAAQMLIQAGARINAQDNEDHTPLKRAIDFEKPAMADYLRSLGGKE